MLSKTATYALRAMGYMASHQADQPILSRVISEKMDIPKNYLSKIMHRLVQAGYLKATRGLNGGFELNVDPSQINLREISEKFMLLDDLEKCFLGNQNCDGQCGLHTSWKPISKQFLAMLETTTINKILR
ncbi:Rrf2 family transcriptional regulator [bacterium]|nr:Rrf2 family transcriptional regulator [bacterium]